VGTRSIGPLAAHQEVGGRGLELRTIVVCSSIVVDELGWWLVDGLENN
jgi:hypothetical protein